MSDLVRFGVAMDRALLADFDERIAQRGYENRSEALRDLVRADLTRAAQGAGVRVRATLTVVLSRKHRLEVLGALSELAPAQHGPLLEVVLDEQRALLVVVLGGPAGELEQLAGRLAGLRSTLRCELTIACAEKEPHA